MWCSLPHYLSHFSMLFLTLLHLKHFLVQPNWVIPCFQTSHWLPINLTSFPWVYKLPPNPHLQSSPSFKPSLRCHILHTMSKSFLSIPSPYPAKMSPFSDSSHIGVVIARPVVLNFGCLMRTCNILFLTSVLNNGCFQLIKIYQITYLYVLF